MQVDFVDATVSYTHDAAGRLTTVLDSQGGTLNRTYDDANRLVLESSDYGTIHYSYNAAGQIASVQANDRPALTYAYDSAGRLQSVSRGTQTFTFAYDALSRRTSLLRPNGVLTTYAYDDAGRLSRLTHTNSSGVVLEDFALSYDADGRVSKVDSLMNHTNLPAAATFGAADALNRIQSIDQTTLGFDEFGELISKSDASGTSTYSWDARGRMVSATTPAGETITYRYDALGRLAERAGASGTSRYLYAGSQLLSIDREGAITDFLDAGTDEHLLQSGSSGDFYFLQDHVSNTVSLTTDLGQFAESNSYTPFGLGGFASEGEYTFAGRQLDPSTGLIYFRSRWYDPQIGRFISPDPLGIASGDANLYSYSFNDPINNSDPSGASPTLATAAVGAGVGAIVGMGATTAGTLIFSGRLPTGSELAAGAVSGAVSGALIGLLGPLAAPAIAGMGGGAVAAATVGGIVGSVAGAAGGAAGAGVNNLLNPCKPVNPLTAAAFGALFGLLGGAIAEGFAGAGGTAAAAAETESAVATAEAEAAVAAEEGAATSNTTAAGVEALEDAGANSNAVAGAEKAPVEVGDYTLTDTVAKHVGERVGGVGGYSGSLSRPYLQSPLTINEIIATGKGVPDPGGLPNAIRFDVPGTFRGTGGTWELVVDPTTGMIYHFLFK